MNEFEDIILPDDFEAQPEAEEIAEIETPVEEVEVTTPTEETEQPTETTEPIKIPIKFNHGEEEIPLDDAIPLIQKGKNYEKAIERARQEAVDNYIANQGYEWNGKPINTEAEYKQAIYEKQLMEQYESRDLPPEVIQELIENRLFREKMKAADEEKAKEEQQNQEFRDFFDYFREVNGREFITGQDAIPESVLANTKLPLKYAFMEHEANQLRAQLKVLKQTKQNEQKAPVQGVSAHGSQEIASEDDFMKGFNSI